MITIRPYQEEAVQSLFDYFANNKGNPIIAMPTGTGKSIVIAEFIRRVLSTWPNQRILVLTHVKELIEQNANKIKETWPMCPLGIYSAGLGRKDAFQPVICGGVASVNNADAILNRAWDLVIIDEAHLVSPKQESTMYGKIFSRLRAVNPNVKLIGLSATPYRLKQGLLTSEGIFNDICFDICSPDAFIRLINEGYLSRLIPKKTSTIIDVSHVKLTAGEFNEKDLQEAADKDTITKAAIEEMIQYGQDRKRWLIFASGVTHAEHISNALNLKGIASAYVSSKLDNAERTRRISDFRNGRIRAIVNNNILTTGFDAPEIDMIGMLRPTMSPGLWVQMLGRGTRVAPGKDNCLVLDFAGNTQRLGPINDPVIPKSRTPKTGEWPVKICPKCNCYNHASVRICEFCAFEFPFRVKIEHTASEIELIRDILPVVETFDVLYMTHTRWEKEGKPPSIKVSYHCGMQTFNNFVCLEHDNYAKKKARDWWRQMHWSEPPATTDEALKLMSAARAPKRIRVHVNKQYPEVLSYEH